MMLTDMYLPLPWYAGGPTRPRLEKLVAGVFRSLESPLGNSRTISLQRCRQVLDLPTWDRVPDQRLCLHAHGREHARDGPVDGLEAVTRADAKIIDEVNKLDLKDLQPTAELSAIPASSRDSDLPGGRLLISAELAVLF